MNTSLLRKSFLAAVVASSVACSAGAWASAPPIPSSTLSSLSSADKTQLKAYVQYWMARLQTTKSPTTMLHAANRILKPLKNAAEPASAVFSYDYGSIINNAMSPLLSHPKKALVAAVTLGRVNDLSTQSSLETALESSNPAVRYWGAVGLLRILPQLESIPPAYQEAQNHLTRALKVETSPLVAAKLADALSQFTPVGPGAFSNVTRCLGVQAKLFHLRPPTTVAQAGMLADSLVAVINAQAHPTAKEKVVAASALTDLLSLTCQYWAAKKLGRTQSKMAASAMTKFANALNIVTGTTDFTIGGLSDTSNADATLLTVNELTGSQGQAGTIQKIFPGVPIPPRIAIH